MIAKVGNRVGRVGPPFANHRPAGPSARPARPPANGLASAGALPSRQQLPRHRAAGPPCGHPAPPPAQRLGFPVGGRKRIPHPNGNSGKHIGKIVSLPPRTPPPAGGGMRVASARWRSRLGPGEAARVLQEQAPPRRAEPDPPWAPRPIRADQRLDSISVPGSLPILIVKPHQTITAFAAQNS